ncbi:hypothetical protein [Pedobacter sp. Leaf194]|uniref:hypothetical protein n=1 Tax=Pedobacter sp. Leaf194 TaxID=1736297 RepID=UPI00070387A5|nr:hypothetical protein [Pedobacter sp. Leaf194]KQS35757.1 hypothetical protein ASG14_09830 [Pedobacter sp. Leaf194]
MVTLKVTINGGIAPLPVKIYVDNLASTNDFRFTRDESFEEPLNLQPGKYSIMVGGKNPENGNTDVSLTGEFIDGPEPQSSFNRSTPVFSVLFFIEV